MAKVRVKKVLTAAQEFNRLVASVSYQERLKTVRAYYPGFGSRDGFDLRKPLSTAKKAKLTKYYKAIRPWLGAPIVRQKLKNADEASAAWRWLHGTEPPLGTLYIPIHESPKNKPRIKMVKIPPEPVYDEFDNEVFDEDGEPVMTEPDYRVSVKLGRNIEAENYFFDDYGLTPDVIATDPEAMLADMLDKIGAPRYAIMCGDYLFSNFSKRRRGKRDERSRDNTVFIGDRDSVLLRIQQLQKMYDDPSKNNYWGNWLNGVKAYFFKAGNTKAFEAYRRKVTDARLERVEMWREIKSLNRAVMTANEQIKTSDREIKFLSSKASRRMYASSRVLDRELNATKRYKARAEKNLQSAMRKRAVLISKMTKDV